MGNKNHERLAEIIVKGIKEAEDEQSYYEVARELSAVSNAMIFAEGRSRLENDLGRFMNANKGYYSEECIDRILKSFSDMLGKEVHFRTIPLFDNLVVKLKEELQVRQDQWETAKLIYALGTLYEFKNQDEEIFKEIVKNIGDKSQRRNATICARVYVKWYEEVFKVFSLSEKV